MDSLNKKVCIYKKIIIFILRVLNTIGNLRKQCLHTFLTGKNSCKNRNISLMHRILTEGLRESVYFREMSINTYVEYVFFKIFASTNSSFYLNCYISSEFKLHGKYIDERRYEI